MTPSNSHLRIATSATIAMGLACALGGVFPELFRFDTLVDALFWPHPPRGGMGDVGRFGIAVGGGILTGFGVAMDRLTRLPDGAARSDIAGALLAGVLSWFVVDSTASVLVGATLNVLGNAAFLALIAPPLMALRRAGRAALVT